MLDIGAAERTLSPQFQRVAGVLVEPVGHMWACYSPLTGETALLNDECAAMLEVLEAGQQTSAQVCDVLAQDSGQAAASLAPAVNASWTRLIEAGLVRDIGCAPKAQ